MTADLPPRPTAADVEDAMRIAERYGPGALAAEVLHLRAALGASLATFQVLHDDLVPLCPCPDDEDDDDPRPGCPIHGDGETFVAEVRALHARVAELEAERAVAEELTALRAVAVAARSWRDHDVNGAALLRALDDLDVAETDGA